MATYTIFHSDHPSEHRTGLSLDDAADHLLSEDGHRWELRERLSLDDLKAQLHLELDGWTDGDLLGGITIAVKDPHDGAVYGFESESAQLAVARIDGATKHWDLFHVDAQEPDSEPGVGCVSLWRSQSSANHSGGPGPMIRQAPFHCFPSKEEALLWVVCREWKGMEALTDQDFAEAHLCGDCSQCGVTATWTSEQFRDGNGPWDSHDGDVYCDDCWAREED